MDSLARFVVRHRWWMIAGWLAFIVIAQALASSSGGSQYRDQLTLPHTETSTVQHLLEANGLGRQTGVQGTVVVHTLHGTATNAPAGVEAALVKLCSTPGTKVTGVTTPWGGVTCGTGAAFRTAGANPTLLSASKPSIALVTVSFPGGSQFDKNAVNKVYDQLKTLRSSSLQVEFTGTAFQGLNAQKGGIPPELLGFIAAFLILGLVFRTVGAVALPLVSAAAALSSGLGLISLLSHALSVSTVTPQLAQLMVIGVGVDYALFIVTRHRRNLLRGMSVPDSIASAVNTSGRAVLFAGTTVCIAMLGLFALRVSFFYGMALGVAFAVSLTMLASLTLLPPLLSLLGLRVLPRKQRRAIRDGSYTPSERATLWSRWSQLVSRRSLLLGGVAAVVIVVLAIPFFHIQLGSADQGTDPAGTTTRTGYDLITEGFGQGYNSTLTLVVDSTEPAALAQKVAAAVKTVRDVDASSVVTPPVALSKSLTIVSLKSTSSPEAEATTDLVHRLRDDVLPKLYNGTGGHVYVYGQTAIQVDFTSVISDKLPYFIGGVVLLSFLLLMIAFRSLVIPLTAAVMNLLAAGASFGVVVAIFQWGWGAELLGIGKGAPIDAFIPVIFFAILFGLSMDYQVFLVSRMHEEWTHTGDNERAVTVGQSETGGIITAAAVIMMAVFSGFILGDARAIKLVGVGLAGAIFLDAFILRTVLVPAAMHLLGRANWYYPSWLAKITPKVSVEPPDEAAPPALQGPVAELIDSGSSETA